MSISDRRRLLRDLSFLLVAACGAPAIAALPSRRSVSFVHTHTGERLTAQYYEDGQYVPAELERVNRLLRDFRTAEEHPIDPQLLDLLDELRRRGGFSGPYEVISGYRSPQTNESLRSRSSGVAEHSLHMQGRAIDVRVADFPTARLRELALAMRRGGVGFYPSSDFVHLDTGRVRFW